MRRAEIDQHYRRALHYLQSGDWPAAEGVLLLVRGVVGITDLAVADALAYALLMQGAYPACARVLEPVLDHPARTFWIAHKYADALRGLHDATGAVRFYRRALEEGSSSGLTARNLLQVLYGESPDAALAELAGWPRPLPAPLLEGAQAAAALVVGPELIEWLHGQGLAGPSLRRRLAEQRLYRLQLVGDLLDATDDAEPQDDQAAAAARWCQALKRRLEELLPGAG